MTVRLLLVEDDRALREALSDTLELAGFDYEAVDSAESAVLALQMNVFGLVISDVNMPGMDGHALQVFIRQRYPQLPVLLMTAYGAVERAVEAMRQGAVDYLVKPFEPKAKLLRVLQEREVERVGARKPVALDIRIIATTNRDLAEEVRSGRFREDLFYRVSVFPLAWAPLRDRPADIVPLAEQLLASHAAKMRQPVARLTSEARQYLLRHAWPGNVRELDNAIQRALILQQGGLIRPEDLCLSAAVGFASSTGSGAVPAFPVEQEFVAPVHSDGSGGLGDDLRRREFELILETLRSERGRRKETADRLGISARTLRYKLAQMRDAGMDIEAMLSGE